MRLLDLLAAEAAQEIIKATKKYTVKNKSGQEESRDIKASEVDNVVTKALGVLQENGAYAALLYLYSRTSGADEAVARQTRVKLLLLLSSLEIPQPASYNASVALEHLTATVCIDLDKLLLLKQLWEQTLIYARYGAKARGVEEEAEKATPQP